MRTFEDIRQAARDVPGRSLAVAGTADPQVVAACAEAYREGICASILAGEPGAVLQLCREYNFPEEGYKIKSAKDPVEEASLAVGTVACGEACALMKGNVKTGLLMKTVLSELGRDRLLSHVFVAELPGGGFMFMSDGGMVIKPAIEEKIQIAKNAVEVAVALGIKRPRAIMLSHDGRVDIDDGTSVEGAVISVMAGRGRVKNACIEGPAVLELAALGGYTDEENLFSDFGGADIVIVPNIEAGNIFGKSIQHMTKFNTGLIIAGAACPIVLTSRADSAETRLNSIALALVASPLK
ncbi:MAG: phosphate acyltransferase [Chloroflexi bacterium]|nr:phosphate acyltransferase [Chloroflexota bacterium]